MLRLFSLPDRESPGIRCQMTARSARPFEPKRGSFFFGRRWGVSGRSNGKPLKPQTAKQCQTVSCCEADLLLSTFPSAIFSFWERIVNFKDFGGRISHFTKKMRRTKGQRWDKVGLSRMRDGTSSRLTIRRKAECTKCERNDNMGDRLIHNLLIIFKCLLGRYKIDNSLDK